MIKYVIRSNDGYMTVKDGTVVWISRDKANTYPSKYAAKKHLRVLNVSETIELEQI